jgi:predicted CxxxxCH...CXXCH cytochrome family protein
MNWTARISLVLIFTLLFSTFIYQGWYWPKKAEAAISTQQAWTNVYHSATLPGATAASFAVNAGSNRMLVVALAYSFSANATQTVTSVTYGGQAMTLQAGDAATSLSMHTYLFYLKDNAVMDGTAKTLAVNITGGTAVMNDIWYAVYAGVDQSAAPITNSQNYNNNTAAATAAFGTALTVNAGDQAVLVGDFNTRANGGVPTYTTPANWTINNNQPYDNTTSDEVSFVASRTIPGTNTTDTANFTAISPTARVSMSGMSIKAAAITTTLANGVAGTTATVCPSAANQKLDGFSFVTSAGTDTVTALTVTTTNYAAIASMQIWDEAGTTQYFGTVNNPGSNTWNFSGGTSIPVSTSAANFKILVTYYGEGSAPAGNTATTANVTAYTCTNAKAGTDTADTTLTLDNSPAVAASWGSNTAGDGQITLNWTYGTGGDSVMIVRYPANTDATMPTDGTTYVVGNPFGVGGTIVSITTAASPWTDSPLTNGTTYYYRIFEYDGCINYAATAPWTAALTPNPVTAKIVYSINTSTPQYRDYIGLNNSFAAQTPTVNAPGANQAFIVDRACPTRNEHMAAYVTTAGELYILRWDGTTWTNEWHVNVGGDGVNGRGFDIAYENTSGKAMVVYSMNVLGNSGTAEMKYRTWDGSIWLAPTEVVANSAGFNQAAAVTWIKLKSRTTSGSNEIALTACDTGTTTANTAILTSFIWNPSTTTWTEAAAAHATNMYNTTGQLVQNDLFDMAYESTSGDLLVVWTQSTPQQYYRTYSAGTWGTSTSFGGTGRAAPLQMIAESDPQSDQILVMWNRPSTTNAVYGSIWSGTAASAISTISTTNNVTFGAANKKTISAKWLVVGGTSYAVAMWNTTTAGTIGYNYYTGAAWGTAATYVTGTGVAASWMDSAVDPQNLNTLMLTFSDANSDLWAKRLVLSAGPAFTWTNADGGTALTTTLASITAQNFSFAYNRPPSTPTTTLGTDSDPASATVCPAAANQTLDAFTFVNSSGTTAVTDLTVTTTGYTAIASMQIWNQAQTTQYFATVNNPGSNTWNFSGGTSITPPTGSAATYIVRVTYYGEGSAPAGDTATTAYVSAYTTTNTKAGTDTAGTTLTLNNSAPANASWGTITPGDGQIILNWTNPADADFSQVVILRNTASISDAPTEGQTYAQGNMINTSEVRYVGNLLTFTDTTVSNGTGYYYKIFAKDTCGNYAAGSQTGPYTPRATTTLGTGSDPANATVCPGASNQTLDTFTFVNSSGTTPVTALTVTTTGYTAIASMQIWNQAQTTQYFATVNNPGSNTWNFSGGTSIPVSTSSATFIVRVTYYGEGSAPAGNTATTAYVSSFTTVNNTAGTDSAGTTLTLDNSPAVAASWGSNTAGDGQVTLNWTYGTGGDSVMIVRYTANTDTTMPTDGTTYVVGNSFGVGGTIVGITTAASPWTDSSVSNGTTYYYKIFEYDGCLNYAATAPWTAALTPKATLTIANGANRPAASTWCPNTAYVIDQFKLTASSGTITVTSITITGSASVTGNITNVKLYKDVNNNGTYESGTDTQVGTTQVFAGNTATFAGLSESINTTGTNYLIVYTVAAAPADGTVLTSQVTTVIASGSPTINNTATVSNNMTIKRYPALITNFTAVCSATSAALTWTNPSQTNLGEVKVLRKTGGYPTGYNDAGATQVFDTTSPTPGGVVNVNDSPLVTDTLYYWAVYSKDSCGNWNNTTTEGSNAANCTPTISDKLTVSNPAHPAAGNVAQASSKNVIDRLRFSASANDVTITSIKVKLVDAGGPTPIQSADIASVQLYDDANQNGLLDSGEAFLGSGAYSSVDGTYTVSGLSFKITAPTTRDMLIVFNIASSAVVGRKFKSQVNDGYVTVASPDQVNTFASITSNTFTIVAGGGSSGPGPTVSIINPRDGGVVSGTFRLQVQIYWGANALSSAGYSTDGGSTWTNFDLVINKNNNYNPGTNSAIYEVNLALATTGAYTLKARGINATGTGTSRSIQLTLRPDKSVSATLSGDGTLLARDNSSQLCLDCHALQTHSSQYSTTGYGNWAVNCYDCHTAHETHNIYLVREQIPTPADGLKDVILYNLPGPANGLTSGTGTGLCEACHSQTAYYKSAGHTPGANGHPGGDCTSCHVHNSGFKKLFCNDCHNAPPNPGGERHPQHYNSATVPTIYTDASASSDTSVYIFKCVKCHTGTHMNDGAHDGLTAPNAKVVEVIFDNTLDPKNPSGSYSAGASTYTDLVNGKYYKYTNGTCNNTYCHSNATPLTPVSRGGNATIYKAPKWTDATTSPNCTVCHKGADTYVNMQYPGNVSALSDAHWLHAASDRYNLGCKRCHSATVSDNITVSDESKHVNGVKNWQFDNNGTFDNTGGSYSAGYQCTNIYCHSAGTTTTAPFGSPTSAAWNATAPLACDSCHYGSVYNTNTNKMSSGKHTQHINQASVLGSNYYCNQCHYNTTTVTASKDAISSYTYHVNGARDVFFDTTGGKVNGGAPNWTAPSTCANIYCHSSGQATPTYRTVPSWTAGGTLDCKGCHGTEGGSLWGEPRYANGGPNLNNSNTHPKHIGPAASSGTANCGWCHPATADSTPAIVASSTIHTDGSRQVAQGGVVTFTYAAGKTCNSISCHNGASGAVWGQTASLPTCLGCHGAAADSNELGANFWKNGTAAKINTTEWTYSGHGKTAGTYDSTLNVAAAFTTAGGDADGSSRCYYCHNTTVGHYDDSNPFRLANYDVTSDDWNSVCLICHKTGSAGYNPGQGLKNGANKVDTAHRGVKHDVTTKGGRFCWDCHDPHGDRPDATNLPAGSNVAMIGRQVMKKNDGTLGYLGASGTSVNVQLYDVVTAGQAVGRLTENTSSPRQGICQACHDTAGATANDVTKYWRSDGTDDADGVVPGGATVASAHNAATNCITCHKHTDNFKGSGACKDCHSATINKTKTDGVGHVIRQIVGAGGDFTVSMAGHLVNGTVATGYSGSVAPSSFTESRGAQIVTNWDCIVCHAEGDTTSSGTNISTTTEHNDAAGHIALRNVDSPGNPGTDWNGTTGNFFNVNNVTWNSFAGAGNTDYDRLDKFCMGCHDSDGASGITVNAANNGLDVGASRPRALTPFNTSDVLKNSYDKWSDSTTADNRTRVTDVKTAFTSTNYSHHAVLLARYGAKNASWNASSGVAWTTKALKNGQVQGGAAGVGEVALLHCSDCHLSTVNAHGAVNSWYMLDNSGNVAGWGTDTLPSFGSGSGATNTSTYVCFNCHAKAVYANVNNAASRIDHTTANSNHWSETKDSAFGILCMNCHGGGGLGYIHGVNTTYKSSGDADTANHLSYRFFPGGWMMWDPNTGVAGGSNAEWQTAAGAGGCYFQPTNGVWSSCNRSAGGSDSTKVTTNYIRNTSY